MSNKTRDWRYYTEVRVDWISFVLVALFAVTIGGALWLRPHLISSGVESATSGTSTATQAAGGGAWAIGATIEAGVLLVALALWSRTPDWLQPVLKRTARLAVWLAIAFGLVIHTTPVVGLSLALGLFAAKETVEAFDGWWIANDALALGIAIYFGAAAGVLFGPIVIMVALVGLTIYDHVFADRRDWMASLGTWTVRNKLPAILVVPLAPRTSWDAIVDAMDSDLEERRIGFGIGMADLALPAAFASAVAHVGGAVLALGVFVGCVAACFRLSWKMRNTTASAGLPSLTTGSLAGVIVASLVVIAL